MSSIFFELIWLARCHNPAPTTIRWGVWEKIEFFVRMFKSSPPANDSNNGSHRKQSRDFLKKKLVNVCRGLIDTPRHPAPGLRTPDPGPWTPDPGLLSAVVFMLATQFGYLPHYLVINTKYKIYSCKITLRVFITNVSKTAYFVNCHIYSFIRHMWRIECWIKLI